MRRLRALWQTLWEDADRQVRTARTLGLVFLVAGFAVVGKAWDGASNLNYLPAQFPYLLSGGFIGLGLILVGCVLLVVATLREERRELTRRLDQVSELLGRNLSRLAYVSNGRGHTGEHVVAAEGSYHRPSCRVLAGKQGLIETSVEQAGAEGLSPCRVCEPPAQGADETETAGSGLRD